MFLTDNEVLIEFNEDSVTKPESRLEHFHKIRDLEENLAQSSTVEQQIEKHLREGYRNRLSEISGQWAGNEPDKEFEELLKDLDGCNAMV